MLERRYAEAEKLYVAASETAPDNADLQEGLRSARSMLKRNEIADEGLRTGTDVEPTHGLDRTETHAEDVLEDKMAAMEAAHAAQIAAVQAQADTKAEMERAELEGAAS
eukprot:COSAG02_NODE_27004_length_619_cov_0.832692_1_plen_108_part_01